MSIKGKTTRKRFAVRFMKWTGIFNARITPKYYATHEAAMVYGDSRSGVGREYATFAVEEV